MRLRSRTGSRLVRELSQHVFRLLTRNDAAEFLDSRAANIGHAAEFPQQLLRSARADARNFRELRVRLALRTALAMEGHREAMGFIANLLNQMQHRRMPVQNDRLLLLAGNVKKLFFLGDADQRLVDEL